jgi:hypothetical protein
MSKNKFGAGQAKKGGCFATSGAGTIGLTTRRFAKLSPYLIPKGSVRNPSQKTAPFDPHKHWVAPRPSRTLEMCSFLIRPCDLSAKENFLGIRS